MKRSLRKGTARISITYSSGDYTNKLVGAEFELEELGTDICLNIDLTGNLLARNKSTDSYADSAALIEDHASLRSVQILDSQVVNGVLDAWRKKPNARWKLKLSLGVQCVFNYAVNPEASGVGLFLNVCGE